MIIVTGFVGKQLVWYVAQSNIKEIHEKQHKEGKTTKALSLFDSLLYDLLFPRPVRPFVSTFESSIPPFPPSSPSLPPSPLSPQHPKP